jgi:hypothetical protein
LKCASFRMKRSQYSVCQNAPVRPSTSLAFRAVKRFHDPTDRSERLGPDHAEQDMDVIGHDRPGVQPVSLTIEFQEGLLDDARNRLGLQPASAIAGIEQFLSQGFGFFSVAQTLHRILRKAVE